MATERAQPGSIPEQQAAAAVAGHDQSRPDRGQWFRHGFDHMPCGMVVMSLTPGHPNVYLAANDSFCRLAGYSRAELAGREFLGDFHPEEQTDVVMPGLTGNAFAARLLAKRPVAKILFMSGYERPQDAGEIWPGESLEVMGKPFSRAALLATVSRLIGTSSAGADRE